MPYAPRGSNGNKPTNQPTNQPTNLIKQETKLTAVITYKSLFYHNKSFYSVFFWHDMPFMNEIVVSHQCGSCFNGSAINRISCTWLKLKNNESTSVIYKLKTCL
jgi:hypothetical protein